MNKIIMVVALILSFSGGWYASSIYQKIKTPVSQASSPAKSVTFTNGTVTTEPVDIYSGTGMSPNKLYDTLNSLTGVDFDKRYINYVILMQSDLTGINRLAKEKAVAPALVDRATELWGLDEERLSALYSLQRTLGYTHH